MLCDILVLIIGIQKRANNFVLSRLFPSFLIEIANIGAPETIL